MEVDTQHYDDIIIGGGKAGKTLAPALVADGHKTALVERSLNMIGGGCINIACIPTKTMVASANVANTVRNSSAYGVKTNTPTVNLAEVIQRKRSVVQSAREMNLHNLETSLDHNLIIGEARFVAPKTIAVTTTAIPTVKTPTSPIFCRVDTWSLCRRRRGSTMIITSVRMSTAVLYDMDMLPPF